MVPQELIDAIISDVDDDDDLRACALASRRFLLPAQRLLFKEMSFPMQQNFRGQGKGPSDPITLLVQRASDILSSSPHLLAFVRRLNVGSMYWEEGWAALKVLLNLCTLRPAKIECFSMEGALEGMPSDVCVALTGIFAQSSLQKVVLWSGHDIPPSTLTAAFASCQNVVVRCNTLEMATAMDSVSPTSKQGANTYLSPGDGATPLECLAMHIREGAGDFLLQPTISRLIRGLRQLEIFADALMAANFCSTTLTHLVLHLGWGLESAEFPRLGALRILTLESTTSAWSIPMEFVALSLPTSLPRLEVLNVSTWIEGPRMAQAPTLDTALTALAFLREVNLTISAPLRWSRIELMHYRNSVEEELPAVHAAGLLTFSQTELEGH